MYKYKPKNSYSNFNIKNILIKTFLNFYSRKIIYSFDNLITYR